MTARIIAVANTKGGVGKTSLSLALCQAWSKQGKRVIALDLDPSAGIAPSLGITHDPTHPAIAQVLFGRGEHRARLVDALVQSRLENVWSVPASPDLGPSGVAATILRQTLEPVMEKADFILLDCQPVEDALQGPFTAAERIVVPTKLDWNSLRVSAATIVFANECEALGRVAGLAAMDVRRPMNNETKPLFEAVQHLRLWVHQNPADDKDDPTDSVIYSSKEWLAAVRKPGYVVPPLQMAKAACLANEVLTYTPPMACWQMFIRAMARRRA